VIEGIYKHLVRRTASFPATNAPPQTCSSWKRDGQNLSTFRLTGQQLPRSWCASRVEGPSAANSGRLDFKGRGQTEQHRWAGACSSAAGATQGHGDVSMPTYTGPSWSDDGLFSFLRYPSIYASFEICHQWSWPGKKGFAGGMPSLVAQSKRLDLSRGRMGAGAQGYRWVFLKIGGDDGDRLWPKRPALPRKIEVSFMRQPGQPCGRPDGPS